MSRALAQEDHSTPTGGTSPILLYCPAVPSRQCLPGQNQVPACMCGHLRKPRGLRGAALMSRPVISHRSQDAVATSWSILTSTAATPSTNISSRCFTGPCSSLCRGMLSAPHDVLLLSTELHTAGKQGSQSASWERYLGKDAAGHCCAAEARASPSEPTGIVGPGTLMVRWRMRVGMRSSVAVLIPFMTLAWSTPSRKVMKLLSHLHAQDRAL